MSRMSMVLSSLAVLAIALGLSGCGSAGDTGQPPPAAPQPEAAGGGEHAAHEHGEAEAAEHEHGEAEAAEHEHGEAEAAEPAAGTGASAGLAELSPEDRAAAEKQGTCPVSDEPLGAMGKPVKITYQGRDLFLCCPMCKDAFDKDPDKYLAKLNK